MRVSPRIGVVLAVSILAVAAACNPLEPCTTVLLPALRVTVVDAATGGAIPAPVTVTVRDTDGSFADSVRIEADVSARTVGLAHERAGYYEVEVTASGYAEWITSVEVDEGDCHVNTVDLTARLESLGP